MLDDLIKTTAAIISIVATSSKQIFVRFDSFSLHLVATLAKDCLNFVKQQDLCYSLFFTMHFPQVIAYPLVYHIQPLDSAIQDSVDASSFHIQVFPPFP